MEGQFKRFKCSFSSIPHRIDPIRPSRRQLRKRRYNDVVHGGRWKVFVSSLAVLRNRVVWRYSYPLDLSVKAASQSSQERILAFVDLVRTHPTPRVWSCTNFCIAHCQPIDFSTRLFGSFEERFHVTFHMDLLPRLVANSSHVVVVSTTFRCLARFPLSSHRRSTCNMAWLVEESMGHVDRNSWNRGGLEGWNQTIVTTSVRVLVAGHLHVALRLHVRNCHRWTSGAPGTDSGTQR